MPALKACFEAQGLHNVATYIQSGNVLFAADDSNQHGLSARIEEALSKTFAYESRIVVRVTTSSLLSSGAPPRELWLPEPERARLAVAAVEAYPREACGLLIGRVTVRAVEVVEIVVADNAAEAPQRAFAVTALASVAPAR